MCDGMCRMLLYCCQSSRGVLQVMIVSVFDCADARAGIPGNTLGAITAAPGLGDHTVPPLASGNKGGKPGNTQSLLRVYA